MQTYLSGEWWISIFSNPCKSMTWGHCACVIVVRIAGTFEGTNLFVCTLLGVVQSHRRRAHQIVTPHHFLVHPIGLEQILFYQPPNVPRLCYKHCLRLCGTSVNPQSLGKRFAPGGHYAT
jgi:hypothetical protein